MLFGGGRGRGLIFRLVGGSGSGGVEDGVGLDVLEGDAW